MSIRRILLQKGIPFLGRHPIFFKFSQTKTMSPQNFCRLALVFAPEIYRWDAVGCRRHWKNMPLGTKNPQPNTEGTYFEHVYKIL